MPQKVAGIMGRDKFNSAASIMDAKINNLRKDENEAMRHGKNTEPKAREYISDVLLMKLEPCVFVKGFMSASLDAWNDHTQTLVEIKCPKGLSYKWQAFMNSGKVPDYYYPQVQAQIYCSDAKVAYFFMYISDRCHKLVHVERDEKFIEKMLNDCGNFYTDLMLRLEEKDKRKEKNEVKNEI